jgi:hypothetical protein
VPLSDECGFFASTFDYWKGLNDNFLGITYHTCTENFEMRNLVLDLVISAGKKYAEHVAENVKQCIASHTSESTIHAASATDKGANVKLASEMLTGEDSKWCFNHEEKKVVDDNFLGTDATAKKAPLAASLCWNSALMLVTESKLTWRRRSCLMICNYNVKEIRKSF